MYRYLSTKELETYITKGYNKLKEKAINYNIFREINVVFNINPPAEDVWGDTYVYSDNGGYHYIGIQRCKKVMHQITEDLFDIAYWIYRFPTFSMGFNFELKNRNNNQDTRRIAFKKALELLDLIGENFRKRDEIDIDEILKESPYDDELHIKHYNYYNI
ncbi:MAG: Imm63 family immunity protein [Eubacteriaceae bacterium]